MKGPQKPNNISSNINPMLCTVLVYFYKRFDQLKRGRFDKLKQGRFDKGFIYFSYDGGNIYSTCFKISTTESEFFDIDRPARVHSMYIARRSCAKAQLVHAALH